MFRSSAARTPQNSICHFLLHLKDVVPAVNYEKLLVGWTSGRELFFQLVFVSVFKLAGINLTNSIWAMMLAHLCLNVHVALELVILAVSEPAETVVNFTEPGS